LFSTIKAILNKGGTSMSKDNVISLENPEENPDILTGLLRSGTRELIKKAVQITGKVSTSISGCVRF
jgi:hypothetical protein